VPGALGLTLWGIDNPNAPPQDTQDYYSFSLSAGQSTTIAAKSLNSLGLQITLVDGNGNVLATGVGGSTNVTSEIENFVAPSDGTYYVEITGTPGVQYSLTVTRSANFDTESNNTPGQAQSITGTNGVLGAIDPGGNVAVGKNIEGIDFNGSSCGCLPPDTNAAVGGNYVVEPVNVQIRVYDKTTGAILEDIPLATFFGASSGGDPYVLFDDNAQRWYVSAFDSSDSGLFLAVSRDANPLDGFLPTYDLNNVGGFPDYQKPGYNKDAIFIAFNDFGSSGGNAAIATIDKNAALGGTLSYSVSHPAPQFRAMTPAQMHGDTTGGTEWFFYSPNGGGGSNDVMIVAEMTNYFSTTPTFTYTPIPVAPYAYANTANQPGGTWTTFPNTTTYEVQYRNGMLVTAMASATAADGFVLPKGLYYEVDVSHGTPTLVQQGVIDPGPDVSVQMPSVDIDIHGNLGLSWMEASSTEYLSMWVGSVDSTGHLSATDVAPGGGFFYVNFRIGDYSTVVLDPSDGTTFWAANEYIGSDGASDIWRTHITSFSVPPSVDNDWYSVNVAAGNTLDLATSTPSDQGGQFINTASLEMNLYDPLGNLVATGIKLGDGRNVSLSYLASLTGQYLIDVYNDPGSSGEYFLSSQTASYASGGISGEVFNDLNGNGNLDSGEPGLPNWEVDVFDANNNLVAAQMTDANGDFNIQGLAPGTYTVAEVLQSGWTQTAPPSPGTFTVTVTAGTTVSGNLFGDFQTITLSGEVFNDLNSNGVLDPGDPPLQGWTIDLFNAAGALIGTTTSDVNGDYSFSDLGPGTYTVQEELQPGWIQTAPPPPGTYTVAATSGQDASGLVFGNFQLATISGQVYDDLNGDGSNDGGTDPGLPGWTVNLLDSSGNVVATTTSDVNGDYSFLNLGYGNYTIEEVNQAGWYQTQPVNPPGTYSVLVTSGADATGNDFGNFQLVSVSGNVYNDLNGNGQQDPGDPGLQGWTLELLDPAGNVAATTTSDANGNYEFANLFPGTFTLVEVLMPGWIQTQPVNPDFYTITTTSGVNITGAAFGNFQGVAVSGNVFNDLDGNGQQGGGEPGLAGWTVNLYNSSDQVVATTTTDANGNYSFSGILVGTYTVAEVLQPDWVQTAPPYPGYYTVTLVSGSVWSGLNYGDHFSPALNPTQVIDNGQPGYAETGSWSTSTGGFNGTTRVARTTPHLGHITATASWTFTGLAAGSYEVFITYAGQSNYATNAPFSVYDGGTKKATVNINESILVTQSQGGLTQGSYGGVGWLELGTFTISSGTLEVQLTNSAIGGYVDADGAMIIDPPAPSSIGSPHQGASTSAALGMGTVPTTQTTSKSSTSTSSFNGPATTVAVNGVTAAGAVHVVYNQGATASNSTSPASLIDAALSQVEKASNNQVVSQLPDVSSLVAVNSSGKSSKTSYPSGPYGNKLPS
jgi:protocatechuate 3,4-dioxygenase beta subunit